MTQTRRTFLRQSSLLAALGAAGLPLLSGCKREQAASDDASAASDPNEAKAREINDRVLKVDPHVDVLLPSTPERYFLPGHKDRADAEKLERGKMSAVAFALAVGSGERTPEGIREARAEIDEKLATIRKFVADNSGKVEAAMSSADIARIHAAGKVAILTSFLNARSIGKNIDAIDELHKNGVRIFGFSHAGNNDFADSSRPIGEPKEEHHGLSALGKQAVKKLNRLGVILDVSQLTPAGVLQTTQLSKAPVIASHSAVRALVDRTRNLSDPELDAIKANGGVVHVTVFNGYLVRPTPEMFAKVKELRARYGLPEKYPGHEFGTGEQALPPEKSTKFDDELAALFPAGTVKDMVDHIDYIAKRIGVDHVGVGSDFNHGSGIDGFNDESETLNVTRELVRRGYSEEDVGKIWGGNFMRVFRQVEGL
jgi:membrane dipeptidase